MSACGVTVPLLYVLTGAECRDSNEAALNDLIAPQNGFWPQSGQRDQIFEVNGTALS
jgi:hypothetical protein